ncbi:Prion-like-(Q/N-rich)-domain-bearing protein [Caenorhabditis elegans]|uniref:Prion-like-(Q/N-rich)-domain-bearing protein n=1 Tax=Caenorhabditis elegans TaxID=6239 RepID=H2KYT4_CAEEL|nr:Prion-like-(Q/N-rich)-domain-bearing protein [Caenorhabditis elegans]CCD64776.1 Prion-like-(Q/N-rich)-domain-bearing protein [Caenorhabditis elegans]|eukprot:NP_509171.3 Uncharacterized protein CELE_F14B8.5 [Caenorhabditis elegans]
MRVIALFVVLGLLGIGYAQYQQAQFQGGQQRGGGYQQGGFQSGGGSQSIQGVQQGGGYGYGGVSGYQSQYGSQSGYGGQMGGQFGSPGRTVYSNNPMALETGSGLMGAEVDLRLISYTNSGLKLPNGTTCNCPISNCNFVPSNHQNQCQFSFVLVISCADQSIQYTQSNFYPVPNNGIITTGNWTNQHTFYMATKPISIDVFVQHLGVVIDSSSGQLLFFNHLSLVDSFVVDLSKFSTNTGNQGQGTQTLTLTGTSLQTQLQMNLNVQCINNFMGPLCDLTCNKTNAQANHLVACFSNRTGTFSLCKWNTQLTQVVECNPCTYGVYNGACAAAVNVNNVGVAYAFRTWTIVLGCLLGIALLLILCLILAYLIILNRSYPKEQYEEEYVVDKKIDVIDQHDKKRAAGSDHGSDQPLITNEEWSSTTAKRKPVGILHQTQNQNHLINQNHQTNQNHQIHLNGSVHNGEPRLDSPSTEDSYMANGQVQHTTTTTTTTTRREQIV